MESDNRRLQQSKAIIQTLQGVISKRNTLKKLSSFSHKKSILEGVKTPDDNTASCYNGNIHNLHQAGTQKKRVPKQYPYRGTIWLSQGLILLLLIVAVRNLVPLGVLFQYRSGTGVLFSAFFV